jgi:predicted Zn-dependent peptidase
MMTAMGRYQCFHLFEQTVYTDDVPSSSLDKYLAVQSERFKNPILEFSIQN